MEPAHGGEGWQLVDLAGGVDHGIVDVETHKLLHHQDLGGDALGPTGPEEHGGFYCERGKKNTSHWFDQV